VTCLGNQALNICLLTEWGDWSLGIGELFPSTLDFAGLLLAFHSSNLDCAVPF
jgi:hypothetical protein